jgi:SAM-dependent methyltransferase
VSKRRRVARRVVADGYDRIAERYARWVAEDLVDEVRPRCAAVLLDGLPSGARVLELGCGGGGATTRRLGERFELTGVDLSARQIALARRNVPNATFVHAEMTAVAFPPERFDGVAAFYALTHLPQGDLPRLLRRVASWLRPGGLLVASMAAGLDPGAVEADWLGAPMYFSGYPPAENRRFLEAAGFAGARSLPQASVWSPHEILADKPP